jgi:hypothetical protein
MEPVRAVGTLENENGVGKAAIDQIFLNRLHEAPRFERVVCPYRIDGVYDQ